MNQMLQSLQEKLGKTYTLLVFLVLSGILFFLGYTSVQPKFYDFSLNQVSELTVRAPKTEEDVIATENARQRARDAIADIYLYNADIAADQVKILTTFLDWVGSLRIELDQLAQAKRTGQTQLTDEIYLNTYHEAQKQAPDQVNQLVSQLDDTVILNWLKLDEALFKSYQTGLIELLDKTLAQEISNQNVKDMAYDARLELQMNRSFMGHAQMLYATIQPLIIPTLVYNEAETTHKKEEAAAQVQPSLILQGQVIVQEGHIIDTTTLRQLDLFGYTNSQPQFTKAYAFYSLVGLHLVMGIGLFTQWFKSTKGQQADLNMKATAYVLVVGLGFALIKILQLMQVSGLSYAPILFPMLVVPMFLLPKTDLKMTLMALVFLNVFALFILTDTSRLTETLLPIPFYSLSGIIVMMGLREPYQYQLNWLYFIKCLVGQFLLITALLIGLDIGFGVNDGIRVVLFSLIGVLIAFIILFFVSPYWEALLSNHAKITLNQLANLNHPLLKQLIEQAPGTYQHSMMVANLSANAVEQIQGNTLLTTVASYYHDLGKTKHPLFFVENMPAGYETPHQMLTPEESAKIITSHTTDGASLLQAHHMPQSVIDICLQHHGTSLVRYFYVMAKKSNPDVDQAAFRYPGPKPQSKEAAVIMIADSVEAAARTLKEHNQATIEQLIDQIVQEKMQDNQFEESGLTVHELKIVKKSLLAGIAGMYHTRIEYPD